MRTLSLIAVACAAITLTACAETDPYRHRRDDRPPPVTTGPSGGTGSTNPLAHSSSYTCEDMTKIVITEGAPQAKATLNSGLELNLQHTGPGRWGATPIQFQQAGREGGLWSNNGKTWRCRAD